MIYSRGQHRVDAVNVSGGKRPVKLIEYIRDVEGCRTIFLLEPPEIDLSIEAFKITMAEMVLEHN